MQGTAPISSSVAARRGERPGEPMPPEAWRNYCREVAAAAAQLRTIAMQAEGAVHTAELDRTDMLRAIARDIGLHAPATSTQARTYATMMLGPFAALEELRRQIKP